MSCMRRTTSPNVHLNMANGVREFARATPKAIAVVDNERELTYEGLEERANRLANLLIETGFQPGDRVALLAGNRLEFIEVTTALAKAGLPIVPLNPRLVADEVQFIMEHSGAKGLILDDDLSDRAIKAVESSDLLLILSMGGTTFGIDYESALASASNSCIQLDVDELDPFGIFYSAGTTGKPKGIVLSHRARTLTAYCSALEWGMGPGKRTIAVAPLYHGAGFSFGYSGVQTGGTVAMLNSFDAEKLLDLVESFRPSTMFLVPTHAHLIRSLGANAITKRDLSSLETLYFNAAPLPHALKLWVLDSFPSIKLHELYGSTEGGIVTDLRPEDQIRKDKCVGTPWLMTEVKVLDDSGNEVPFGGTGELYSRSPFLMTKYWNDPEATKGCMTEDGFLSAGDIATLDDEGYIYIVDRKKDMIISGGMNIYPRDIEEILMIHPSVSEASVVGLPSEKWGEEVTAFVVMKADMEFNTDDLEAYCKNHLAGFKVPRRFQVVNALPKNSAGKVLKRELRTWSVETPETSD